MFANLHQLSHHHAWRRQLELLLESTGDGIYGIDLRGRCIFINGSGASMLGYSPDEVLGRNMHYLIHHSRADASLMPVHDCRIFKAFQEGLGARVDDEVLWRRDGTAFAAEYASHPIRDKDQVLGAVVTFSDISQRKSNELALKAAHDELELRVQTRTAELSASTASLHESHQTLQRLSAHLNTVREEERRHIARDIHDDLGASLTALQLDLNWLRKRHERDVLMRDKIDDMLQIAGTAMGAVRRILSDLRPGVLDHLGVWAAIESLLTDFQRRTGVQCSYQCPPDIEAMRMGHDTEITLYRIAQEILTNVARHAHAQHFSLVVMRQDKGLHLVFRDDGCGMPTGSSPGHFGILGMQERARALGAELNIQSAAQAGTAISLFLPDLLP